MRETFFESDDKYEPFDRKYEKIHKHALCSKLNAQISHIQFE